MVAHSRKSVSFSRRSFVEKMGLGVGASLLGPLARNLIREAQGQAVNRQVAMFWMGCNGINPNWVFAPPEFKDPAADSQEPPEAAGEKVSSQQFTVPLAFAPLAGTAALYGGATGGNYRQQMVLLEGMKNHPRIGEDRGHGCGYMALSCVPGQDFDHLVPGGITFDQHLANALSRDAPRKSINIGISSKQDAAFVDNLFAEGPNKSVPAFQSPVELFKTLFAGLAPAGGGGRGGAVARAIGKRERLIFDTLKADITRLEAHFAAPEKDKLSGYLAAIEAREKQLTVSRVLSCNLPAQPSLTQANDPVEVLEALNNLASIALICGVSNVLGVDIGCGDSHDFGPDLHKLLVGSEVENAPGTSLANVGHEQAATNGPVIARTYNWVSSMAVKTLDALLADTNVKDAFVLISSDNGETHHSAHNRWPAVVAGRAGSLKLDGRYIRYPGTEGRSLVDLYLAIGQGLGVPQGSFGTGRGGPNVASQGPLPDLI
ncbi:MAG: DUF1552 domain-containing protein [Polyangiaceae bacterium]|nr:DUF1552 domain-containing protein [Polyangiaceae bacterium]